MARFAILVSFFAAGTDAERVAKSYVEHQRHADAQASEYHPLLHKLAIQPLSAQMQGAPVLLSKTRVGDAAQLNLHGGAGHRVLSPSSSPGMSMQEDPVYQVDLRDDWKSPTGNFALFHKDGLTATPPPLKMNLGKLIKDWTSLAKRNWMNIEINIKENPDWNWNLNSSWADRKQEMAIAWRSLKHMSKDMHGRQMILDSIPIHVFGLDFWESTGANSPERIQAIASVEFLSGWDGNLFSLADPYVHILDIVSTPNNNHIGKGGGVEVAGSLERVMLDKIIDYAKLTGKSVIVTPANDDMAEIYRRLGFEVMPTAQRGEMVYSEDGERAEEGEPLRDPFFNSDGYPLTSAVLVDLREDSN